MPHDQQTRSTTRTPAKKRHAGRPRKKGGSPSQRRQRQADRDRQRRIRAADRAAHNAYILDKHHQRRRERVHGAGDVGIAAEHRADGLSVLSRRELEQPTFIVVTPHGRHIETLKPDLA